MTDHDKAQRAAELLAQALEILRPVYGERGESQSVMDEGWPLHLAFVQTGLAVNNLRQWLQKSEPAAS